MSVFCWLNCKRLHCELVSGSEFMVLITMSTWQYVQLNNE
ncbi:hypothetical protein P20311_1775 [Pseudoalteromonas sp. BSi20311]|nr:hypothetical protein P20311_1775 [Pseudoalteromonas sp. BSi20311]